MMRPLILAACLVAGPALAETSLLAIAQDRYEAGATVRFAGPPVQDLFMAGNRVVVAAPVAGAAHLVARRVTVEAAVAGDLFAAGYRVEVSGVVGGDATVMGYEVITGSVTGNLRAAGSEVTIGSVGGYALITGADVRLTGAITGDAVLVAEEIEFGTGSTVAGTLKIYAESPSSIVVPATVAPAARVTILQRTDHDRADWSRMVPATPSLGQVIGGFLMSVLISGLIATMVIAIAPNAVQSWRELALAHPGRAIWSGFLVTSALAGSGFVLMLTIIGVFLLPVMLIVTAMAIFAGYALGSYVLGVGLWLAAGRMMPGGLAGKFALACLGAFFAGLAWLVPVAGWFFVLGVTMLGIGTLAAFALPRGWLMLDKEPAT
ncbi:MAG: hypothetical protein U0934_09820 [Pseudotabrizicola sp.]|uniref:hypothetical protein n=1 Tax=Pseudotabrizicola sp. TaxID=2939647 RepID=UPI002731524C|nr:hypothetical protein [Pseudotabrizicola sp.]MDP2079705.1 hypothetical protein [Pseudotabrizicola sp.]MDZ7574240.1 hypothetical protein [Pseudotabrizicola sp.]